MITVPIFLVLRIYIRLTRLLEDGAPHAKFDVDRKLYPGSTSLNGDDSAKIKEAIAANKDDKDEEQDLWEKNK